MSSLIPHPEIWQRRERIESLRRELAEAFDRHIRLTFEILPALRARYEELFGELERQVQARTLERSRRRRMVELFALKLDRGEKLDARMVELVMKAVGAEFGRIGARAERSGSEMRRREGRQPISQEHSEETPRVRADEGRRLYRQLARRLHPDVAGDDDTALRYWHLAQEGYLRGDLQLLRALAHLVGEVGTRGDIKYDAMVSEEKRLLAAIRVEQLRIESVMGTEPYTIREDLDDEQWVASRRDSIQAELDETEREIEKCNGFLDPILAMAKDASPPAIARDIWANFVETMYINNR